MFVNNSQIITHLIREHANKSQELAKKYLEQAISCRIGYNQSDKVLIIGNFPYDS